MTAVSVRGSCFSRTESTAFLSPLLLERRLSANASRSSPISLQSDSLCTARSFTCTERSCSASLRRAR